MSIERSTLGLVAATPAGVLPVHLDQPVMSTEGLIVGVVADRAGGGSELPGALVSVLRAAAVVPGVEIGIRNSLLRLVRHDGRHAVRTAVAIRTRGLNLARRRTPVWIPHESVLDVRPANGRPTMPTAVLGAEAGGFVNVRRGQNEIESIRVFG